MHSLRNDRVGEDSVGGRVLVLVMGAVQSSQAGSRR